MGTAKVKISLTSSSPISCGLVWTCHGRFRESGVVFHLSDQIPKLIGDNIERCLNKALLPLGVEHCNSPFWITHPGGPATFDLIGMKFGVRKEKFEASVYGNVLSSAVYFVLDEMRVRMKKVNYGQRCVSTD